MQSATLHPTDSASRAVTSTPRILRAEHLGMCFGVRDAIQIARRESSRGPLTVLGDLVHNETVLADLRQRGVRIAADLPTPGAGPVMITAHGASDRRRAELRSRGLTVLEATCPLVKLAHTAVQRLAASGYHPVIVGVRTHVEVRGLTEDLAAFDVVLTDDDVGGLAEHARFGVAAQTTQPIVRVRHLAGLIRKRFPQSEVRLVDTVCQPTKLRQHAAEEVARHSDVVIVVGGATSNNTRELAETCRRHCSRVHQVQGPEELDPAWLAAAATVGLTAGTSTPDTVIDRVEAALHALLNGTHE